MPVIGPSPVAQRRRSRSLGSIRQAFQGALMSFGLAGRPAIDLCDDVAGGAAAFGAPIRDIWDGTMHGTS